jgi:phosphoribosylglycinamide formyltransferase-1
VLPGDDVDRLAARVLAQEHLLYPLALRLLATRVKGMPPAPDAALCNPLPSRAVRE